MINNYIILQSQLIYFKKICYIVRNSKKKIKPSPPKPSIQTHLKSFYLSFKFTKNFYDIFKVRAALSFEQGSISYLLPIVEGELSFMLVILLCRVKKAFSMRIPSNVH